jgi:hypothetical protein
MLDTWHHAGHILLSSLLPVNRRVSPGNGIDVGIRLEALLAGVIAGARIVV